MIVDYPFYSKINELEDVFLGCEIEPDKIVERVFCEVIYPTTEDGEYEYKEVSRANARLSYDYMEDAEEFPTAINYKEFDFYFWEEILFEYERREKVEALNIVFEQIDEYLANSEFDFATKSFAFRTLWGKVLSCREEIKSLLEGKFLDDGKPILNEPQRVLAETFCNIYGEFAKRMQRVKYKSFMNGVSDDEELSSKSVVQDISSTPYYQKLKEIDFIKDIEREYPKISDKIIATLGRSREFGGIIIDSKKVYYALCSELHLIKKLEDCNYYSNQQIGTFLANLSKFETNEIAKTFSRYYGARYNERSKQHPFTSTTREKLDEILYQISRK